MAEFLANLSDFLAFFVVAVVLTILFLLIYTRVTRHDEFALIKQQSVAASIAFPAA